MLVLFSTFYRIPLWKQLISTAAHFLLLICFYLVKGFGISVLLSLQGIQKLHLYYIVYRQWNGMEWNGFLMQLFHIIWKTCFCSVGHQKRKYSFGEKRPKPHENQLMAQRLYKIQIQMSWILLWRDRNSVRSFPLSLSNGLAQTVNIGHCQSRSGLIHYL